MAKTDHGRRTLMGLVLALTFMGALPLGCTSSLRSIPGSSGKGSTKLTDANGLEGVGAEARAQSDEAEDVSFLTEMEQQEGQETQESKIRIEKNHRVEYFISLFSGADRSWVQRALGRSGRYIDRMRGIFREEGLPEDLVYLALIESGFNPYAYSRAGAVGVWQFMPSTGRRYGLVINWWLDERRDLEKSTRAAARYLRDLYGLFDDWYLAAAAYNAGEGRLGRAIKRFNTNDFWDLSRERYLKKETCNYVPRFLAILTIAENPGHYGFEDIPYEDPLLYEIVPIKRSMDLSSIAEACDRDLAHLKKLNPQLSRGCTPPSYRGPYEIKIPAGTRERFLECHAKIKSSPSPTFVNHQIRRGETLSRIADQYGISVQRIVEINQMTNRNRICAGMNLVIPVPERYRAVGVSENKNKSREASQSVSLVQKAERTTYKVRRGDTLSSVARKNRVSTSQLREWNGLGRASRIRSGQNLVVWKENAGNAEGSATHVVQKGESLFGIASAHGVTLASLKSWNGLSDSSSIHPGQKLLVRPKDKDVPQLAAAPQFRRKPGSGKTKSGHSWYSVRRGDTLWSIARRHGITVAQLCNWNDIDTRQSIYPGLRLKIYHQEYSKADPENLYAHNSSIRPSP